MSMLAERRTKKKWCLNPNGKDWSNDDNKFGQRMLEKMGWKKGCGLGANLQGMREHVRVSAKNDMKGLGCTNSSDTEWIHHQQNFESLLSELASSTFEEIRPPGPSEVKPVSLEEKSKKSRVRVHYQRFTRGKDVSRYSASDLACIFGKKNSFLDSKSFELQYSCHDTRNTSEADSESGIISEEHTVGQSLNLCEEKIRNDCLPSMLPKHKAKDQPVDNSLEDKDVQEKQSDILKEISNVEENSFADMDTIQECVSEMGDNSASHFSSVSVEKTKNKRKRKHMKDSENNQEQNDISKEISNVEENSFADMDTIQECVSEMGDNSASHFSSVSVENTKNKRKRKHMKDSENNQEVLTETIISSSKEKVNECDTVDHKFEETVKVQLEVKKKRKKKKKDKKNDTEVQADNEKEDKTILRACIEATSDSKEIGNKELENISVKSEADNRDTKIKRKKIRKLHNTHISEEHEEPPETKKTKKKKMSAQSLNESDVIENIKSESISLLPSDNGAGINNSTRSVSFSSESFSSCKKEPQQYGSNNAKKSIKSIKKHYKKLTEFGFTNSNMEFGFRGSNLHLISGYGSV